MNFEEEHARQMICLAQKCCEGPVDPILLRKFFKTAVKVHWGTSSNHGRYEEILGCYNFNSEKSPLTVMMAHEDMTGERISYPRIIVRVGDQQVSKKVIGNVGSFSDDNASMETSWQIDSTLTFSHIFQDVDICYAAAQSTFEFVSAFTDSWRSIFALQLFDPIGVSTEKLEKPHPENYFRVDATFKLNYNFVITVNTESHRLKVIARDVTIT